MTRFASLLCCFLLVSGAHVAAAPAEPTGSAAPPLTATFESVFRTRGPKASSTRERWTLAREPGRVAYTFGQAAERRLDVWSQAKTQLKLLRVFPQEQTTVEYTQGQLRALGDARSWQQLSSLLPEHPAKLGWKQTGTGTLLQRKTQRFEGQLDGARAVVEWLEPEQLPARLSIVGPHAERSITLQKLTLGQAQTPPEATPTRYRRIDAADLGDLEHDPFVKRHSALLHTPHHL